MSNDKNLSIDQILDASLGAIGINPTTDCVEKALTNLVSDLAGASSLRRKLAFSGACKRLRAAGVDDPEGLMDVILGGSGNSLLFTETEPWPDLVDAADVLSQLQAFVMRFVVCSDLQAAAVVLWIAMTWVMDAVQTAPLLVISAPEKRCGKTTLLGLLKAFVKRPIEVSNISAAALFRVVEQCQPTLLIDEGDSFVNGNEDLRGILNAGHTRQAAFVLRTVLIDGNYEPRRFSVWCAKAIALIGGLQGTLEDRAIIIRMRRRLSHERVKPFREREHLEHIRILNSKLARFAIDTRPVLEHWQAEIPSAISSDRARDNWEPLLALAEAAGGTWPALARRAAEQITLAIMDTDRESRGVQALSDIREYFRIKQDAKVSTDTLLAHLRGLSERPWSDEFGKGALTARELAGLLTPYDIHPHVIRMDRETTLRGYEQTDFRDAFARYLPQA